MSGAEKAYKTAQEWIAEAAAGNDTTLDLNVEGLATLPPEIENLTALQTLDLRGTHISDITPIAKLTALQNLELQKTGVGDITPLANLTKLQSLKLRDTLVADIAPIENLTELEFLNLSGTQVDDITPVANLTALEFLNLSGTQVDDITSVANLTALEFLSLNDTKVDDIAPIANLTALKYLYLSDTHLNDITPIANLTKLETFHFDGNVQLEDLRPILNLQSLLKNGPLNSIFFHGSKACERDPNLARLAEIPDGQERTQKTFDYLRTLPKWPAPLPWEAPIEQVALPKLVLSEDQRVDVVHTQAPNDPVTAAAYKRLQRDIPKLQRFTNQYADLNPIYESLSDLIGTPMEDVDLLILHLDIADLEELQHRNQTADAREQFDDECRAVIDGIMRVAPPITMGHPDVVEFEARQREYKDQQITKAVKKAELALIRGIASSGELITQETETLANRLSQPSENTRLQTAQSGFARNATVILFHLATALPIAATEYVATEAVKMAAQFVAAHATEILAIAPTWGMNGLAWAESIIHQVRHFLGNLD